MPTGQHELSHGRLMLVPIFFLDCSRKDMTSDIRSLLNRLLSSPVYHVLDGGGSNTQTSDSSENWTDLFNGKESLLFWILCFGRARYGVPTVALRRGTLLGSHVSEIESAMINQRKRLCRAVENYEWCG